MAATDYTFKGWVGHDPESVKGKMVWEEFEPKKWTEDDVDIQITHSGICGSDLHVLSSGWGPSDYPCCVGHEIVGRAVRVGSNVKHVKVGDRVGLGAQSKTCGKCTECAAGMETYCSDKTQWVDTYNGRYPNGEGKSMGGHADYNRAPGQFIVKIPEGLASEAAAPMLCGGITVYQPLRDNGCGPGKTVGIVGVGGLGHFAVLFAKAMGADKVIGISRRKSKEAEVLALGADQYIATADEPGWDKTYARSCDLIICTVSTGNMPFNEYMALLKAKGTLINVGAPEGGVLPPINAFTLIMNGIKVGGSLTGSPSDIKEMLQFAVDHKIKPWVQLRPMEEANKAIVEVDEGKPRYRYVLVNEKHLKA